MKKKKFKIVQEKDITAAKLSLKNDRKLQCDQWPEPHSITGHLGLGTVDSLS